VAVAVAAIVWMLGIRQPPTDQADASRPMSSAPVPADAVVAIRRTGEDADIVIVGTGATEHYEVLAGPTRDTAPALSPDRRSIVYIRTDPVTLLPQLRLMGADGTGDRALLTSPDAPCEYGRRGVWSPAGTELVILCVRSDRSRAGLWVVALDGAQVRELPTADNVGAPAWHPGEKIMYWQAEPEVNTHITEGGGGTLWVVDPYGAEAPLQLTHNLTVEDDGVEWSPDRTQALFVRAVGTATDLWLMNADGSDQREVTTTGDIAEATWLPSGDEVIFASERDDSHLNLWVMSIDGTNPRLVEGLEGTVSLP